MRGAAARLRRRPFAALLVGLNLLLPLVFLAAMAHGPRVSNLVFLLQTVSVAAVTAAACAERSLSRRPAAGKTASAAAQTRWVARLADPAAGQCPVCAIDDLDQLAAEDRSLDRSLAWCKVVPYGRHRAHWDCAELVPHVPTPDELRLAAHNAGKHRPYPDDDRDCALCVDVAVRREREMTRPPLYFEVDGIPTWSFCGMHSEPAVQRPRQVRAQRALERSWPELLEGAPPGAVSLRVTQRADTGHRHWLLNSGGLWRQMDVVHVAWCQQASDGAGFIAHLAEPLHHGLTYLPGLAQQMIPMDWEQLWNREAGRPYTRTEMGLCDCPAHHQPATEYLTRRFTVHGVRNGDLR